MKRINEKRRMWKCVVVGIFTLGLYLLWFWRAMSRDINTMLRGDGKHTRGIAWRLLLYIPTFGIGAIVWRYKVGERLRCGLHTRGLDCGIDGSSQVLLFMMGLSVVADFTLIHAVNRLAQDYNSNCE